MKRRAARGAPTAQEKAVQPELWPADEPIVQEAAAYALDDRPVAREAFYAVACHPARSVVVEACAGAGKTWMLVSRILRALLAGVLPQQIVAITFTRKAAGEMRQRLDEWLSDFAAADDAQRIDALVARGLDIAAAREAAPHLQRLQQALLDGGRPVEICTFHAWFAKLLWAAPMSLLSSIGLEAGRELLEDEAELEAELFRRFHAALLVDEARLADQAALQRRYGRARLHDWLVAAWQRRIELSRAGAAGTLESSVPPENDDGRDPAARLRSAEVGDLLRALAVSMAAHKGKTIAKCGAGIASALDLHDDRAALAALRQALFTEKGSGTPRAIEFGGFDRAVALLDELQGAVEAHDAWDAHQRMSRLSRVLIGEYERLKRDRGIADMADLERGALALLQDSALAGWVQQRLDARVRQLLIDEFQDTSPLQWRALSAWLGSYAGAGSGEAPSVFIVGDPKQSIYRFRGADPRVFASAREFVREAFGGAVLSCAHTRRCSPGVLAAVNRVFEAAGAAGRFDGFRPHTTAVPADAAAAAEQAVLLPTPPRPIAERTLSLPEQPWRDSLTMPRRDPVEAFRLHEARKVAGAIASLLASGTPPSDIFVLARQRAALAPVAKELQLRGVPHASTDKLPLLSFPEVRDLVALLDVLASPTHDLSLAQVLRSALFGIDDATLLRLARAADGESHRGRWWSALMSDDSDALGRPRRLLARWFDAAAQLPPHDLLDTAMADADYAARLAARVPPARRAEAVAAVDALLAASLGIDGARYPTIYGFVRALRRRASQVRLTPPHGAVQLLTIHAAKGLEAPVVFLVDADAPTERGSGTMTLLVDWPVDAAAPRRCVFLSSEKRCPPSLAGLLATERSARARESLNALYVAMTRAGGRLVVSRTAPAQGRQDEASWWPLLEPHLSPWEVPDARAKADAVDAIVLQELPSWQAPAIAPPDEADDTIARLGTALHRVLEWASRASPAGSPPLAPLVRAAARQWQLGPEAEDRLQAHAEAVIGSPECRRFYDPTAYVWAASEVPLAIDGEPLRADRLVALERPGVGREWWVLDLKLHPAPDTVPEYRAQIERYRAAVARAQPGDAVRAAFVTAQGRLVELR